MRRALVITVVAAVLGGLMGWFVQIPVFGSEATLLVQPSPQSLEDPGGRGLPMFQAFVAYHAELLRARRTTLLALQTEPWTSTGEGTGPAAAERFEARRTIVHEVDTQLILVRFEAVRPEVALAGVQALLAAHEILLADAESHVTAPLTHARSEIESATARVAAITEEMLALTAEFGGVEALEVRLLAVLEELLEAEREGDAERVEELRELSRRLAGVQEQVARLVAERAGEAHKLEKLKVLAQKLEHQLHGSGRVEVLKRAVLPTEPSRRVPSWTPVVGAVSAALLALLLARLMRRRD